METEEQKPVPPTVQSNPPVLELRFTDQHAEPEVTAEDLIAEDIDDLIPELPIEEAEELYNIVFVLIPSNGISNEPLKRENGTPAEFDSFEAAEKALSKLGDRKSDFQVMEQRHKKPEAAVSVDQAPTTLSMK